MSLASMTVPESVVSPAPKRPKTTRPTSRPAELKPKKVSVYLSGEAIRRLDIHVAMDGGDRSRLVEQLIQEGLRRYEMPRLNARATRPASEPLPVGEIGSEAAA